MKTLLVVLGIAAVALVALVGVWVYVVQNVETPAHETLAAEGDFELRAYPALTLAEIERTGPRREALGEGFGPLARYIFAREREGPSIAMTVPVTQRPGGEGGWTVGFVMPAEMTLDALPRPADAEIRLVSWPERRMAAVRFSGHATDADLAAREADLRAWMAGGGLEAAGPAVFAYYNDPLTPGFLRRNEVLIPVASPQAEAATAASVAR